MIVLLLLHLLLIVCVMSGTLTLIYISYVVTAYVRGNLGRFGNVLGQLAALHITLVLQVTVVILPSSII